MMKFLKLFTYIAFTLAILPSQHCYAQSPIEELTQQKSSSGGNTMRTRSFGNKKEMPKQEQIQEQPSEENAASLPVDRPLDEIPSKKEKKEDPEDKIWRKYKKIAKSDNGNTAPLDDKEPAPQKRKHKSFATEEKRRSFNDDSNLNQKAKSTDPDEETASEEETESIEQEEEQKNGLSQALDGYLDKTGRNTKMGRRSFGNPEDRIKEKKSSEKPNNEETKKEEQEPHYQE